VMCWATAGGPPRFSRVCPHQNRQNPRGPQCTTAYLEQIRTRSDGPTQQASGISGRLSRTPDPPTPRLFCIGSSQRRHRKGSGRYHATRDRGRHLGKPANRRPYFLFLFRHVCGPKQRCWRSTSQESPHVFNPRCTDPPQPGPSRMAAHTLGRHGTLFVSGGVRCVVSVQYWRSDNGPQPPLLCERA
jgi:hypothetical protein